MVKEIKKGTYFIFVSVLFVISIGFALTSVLLAGNIRRTHQTFVGTIPISNYDEGQYSTVIANELNEWKDDSEYTISYQNLTLVVDLEYFESDVNETIDQLVEDQVNTVVYDISDTDLNSLYEDLETCFTSDIIALIDFDKLVDDIISDMELMSSLNDYELFEYFESDTINTILTTITVTGLDSDDVDEITENISSMSIEAMSRFSLLDKTYGLALTNNQLSIIASAIQSLTMDTNLIGFVFAQNSEIPSWGAEGMNVRILKLNNYDFSFFNDFNYAMEIEILKTDGNSLTFNLKGYPYSRTYSSEKTKILDVEYSTRYVFDEAIIDTTPGVVITETDDEFIYQLLSQIGIDGKINKFVRTVTNPDSTVETITLYYEEYQPTEEIYLENYVSKDGE